MMWASLGQPFEDNRQLYVSRRFNAVDVRCWPAGFILCNRRQDVRRDLFRIQIVDGRCADVAEVGVWVHPVQAAIHQSGGVDGGGEGISRSASSGGRTGDRLVPLHQDGRDGYGPGEVAGPGWYEPRAACDELPHHDQRVAALYSGGPVLQDGAGQGMVHAPGGWDTDQWIAV